MGEVEGIECTWNSWWIEYFYQGQRDLPFSFQRKSLYLKNHLEWGVITYTFHPFVIGRGHRMLALEKLVRILAENGATFMKLEEAAAEFDRRMPLPPSQPAT